MSRGYFDFIKHNPAYADTQKDWYVELLNSTCFWFDLLIDPPQGFDANAMARQYLNDLRDIVRRDLDKHFVYFLVSRQRVRFSTKREPRYSLFGGKLILYVEIGRLREERRCVISLRDLITDKPIRPTVKVTDRIITFHFGESEICSIPIYDFLNKCGVDTGISSEVHYVGYTSNPAERAIDREHRGFGDMLHWTSREDEAYDYFVFYNLFKVTSVAFNQAAALNFVLSNAMIDEVGAKSEGRILEKILIKYFGSKTQEWNKQNESGELNNSLQKMAKEKRINSVTIDLQMAEFSELFRFFSRSVKPMDRHHFTCQMGESGAEIIAAKDFSIV